MIYLNKVKKNILILISVNLIVFCTYSCAVVAIDVYPYNNEIFKELSQSNYDKKIYIYIDNVTPIRNFNNLVNNINYLDECGVKYFFEISPVFINQDLKYMDRFYEIVRYAQIKGASVVLRLPIINDKLGYDFNCDNAINLMNKSLKNYIEHNIYPTAINVDKKDLYYEKLQLYLKDSNLFVNMGEYNKYNNYAGDVCIAIQSDLSNELFTKEVDKIIYNEIELLSSVNMNSTIDIYRYNVKTDKNAVYLNNEEVDFRFDQHTNYTPRNMQENIDRKEENIDLQKINNILVMLSFFSVLGLLLIVVISKEHERRNFFK